MPSNFEAWPEGTSFYHYDQIYDAHNVGYAGPEFSYAQMPDQYILSAFQRLELAKPDQPPVMAEIDLVSSHTPWAPLPTMVDWDAVGDGSIFDGMPAAGRVARARCGAPTTGSSRPTAQSIQYSLTALTSFVDPLPRPEPGHGGTRRPPTRHRGQRADPPHDVPISIIAHDPAVLDRCRVLGMDQQACARPTTRRSGRWTLSATDSSTAFGS